MSVMYELRWATTRPFSSGGSTCNTSTAAFTQTENDLSSYSTLVNTQVKLVQMYEHQNVGLQKVDAIYKKSYVYIL